MARPRSILAALCLLVLDVPPVLAADPVRVESRPGRVVGVDARGAERWAVQHPSLGEGKKKADAAVGPAMLGRRAFYAIGGDLLELDPARGRVVRRTRFPAPIVAVAPHAGAEPALAVTIASFGSTARRDQVTVRFRPDGPRPGRGFWSYTSGGAVRDARTLVPGYSGANAAELAPAARDAAIPAFERAEAADPTNPFYPAFRGRLLASAGRRDDAARAFVRAAELPAASWADLLTVSSTLEDAEAREPARRAFARGVEGLRAAGLRSERVHSLIGPLVLLAPPRAKVKQLADAGDVERYDEVLSRLAVLFPQAEWLDRAWASVAAWMRARGRDDLARKWAERAAVAEAGPFQSLGRVVGTIDPMIPFILGAWAAALAIALAAGLRGGAALARRRAAGAVAGVRRWLPRPRGADLISLGLALVAALGLSVFVAGWIVRVGTYAGVPLPLFDDGAAAPQVERWLAERPAGPARDRWLEYARQEARATRGGDKYAGAPPDDASFREMLDTVPLAERLRLGTLKSPVGMIAFSDASDTGSLQVALVGLALFVAGALVGLWLPAAARFIAWAVPGGPASLSVAGGLVATVGIAAGFTLAGLDRTLRTIAAPAFGSIIGLPAEPVALPTPAWAWVALALCLALHVGAAWRDARRARATAAA